MINEFVMREDETVEEFKRRIGICTKDDGIKLDELELGEGVDF